MTFSIITPSFDQPDWLRLCLASVADQEGVAVEHIVQDNHSGGAVGRVAAEFPGARWVREADAGMYDALNRGLERATGDICGYLNCDEQYLPGALAAVGEVFERNPEVDLVTGDGVVMDAGGRLLAARRGVRLRAAWIEASHMTNPTSALFFRRRVWDSGIRFDPDLKSCGDADWAVRVLRAGFRPKHLRRYLSVYTQTGRNLSARRESREEERRWRASRSVGIRLFRRCLTGTRILAKAAAGCYRVERAASFFIHPPGGCRTRIQAVAPSLGWAWPKDE